MRKLAALPLGIGMAMMVDASAAAAEISFGHFAPSAGAVRLEIDSDTLATTAYRDFVPGVVLPSGKHMLRAVGADGRSLAHGELALRNNDAVTVMLAGNGTARAPFELRFSLDHNHPVAAAEFSLQSAGLAIAAELVELRDTCNPSSPRRPFAYGSGSASMTDPEGASENLSRGPLDPRCGIELAVGGDLRMKQLLPIEPGTRARAFAIGDGVNEPYELAVVQQGPKPETSLPLGPDVAGLWYPPGERPGISVMVSYDAAKPEGSRVSAIVAGYDHALAPTWRVIDADLQISEYRGGNPAGTRPAMPHTQGRLARIVWHSCSELTLVPMPGEGTSGMFNRMPRDAMRLRRLLPAQCQAATAQEAL